MPFAQKTAALRRWAEGGLIEQHRADDAFLPGAGSMAGSASVTIASRGGLEQSRLLAKDWPNRHKVQRQGCGRSELHGRANHGHAHPSPERRCCEATLPNPLQVFASYAAVNRITYRARLPAIKQARNFLSAELRAQLRRRSSSWRRSPDFPRRESP